MRRVVRLLVAVFVVGAAVMLAAPGVGGQEPEGLARARAAKAQHEDELFARPGVVGVGLTADGSGPAIVVLTSRTVSGLPRRVDGVRVKAVVTGPIRAVHHRPGHDGGPPSTTTTSPTTSTTTSSTTTTTTQPGSGTSTDPTSRFDAPVPIGVSTGPAGECSAGTLGAELGSANGEVGLSNNHVWARENAAAVGEPVYQPGRYDTGCVVSDENLLGTLVAFVPLEFGGGCGAGGDNVVDAAIADPSSRDLTNTTPPNGYGTLSTSTTPAAVNQAVQKYGRTSGLTAGTVVAVDVSVNVGYGSGVACFRHQIWVQGQKPFLKAGDSGSLLVTDDGANHPVGLLFAADNSGKNSFANPISDVLDAFGGATIAAG